MITSSSLEFLGYFDRILVFCAIESLHATLGDHRFDLGLNSSIYAFCNIERSALAQGYEITMDNCLVWFPELEGVLVHEHLLSVGLSSFLSYGDEKALQVNSSLW